MKAPKLITFYSFKGGVGRSLALLNVAVILARAGQRVIAVDMDLEAPGFHRCPALGPFDPKQPGVSDFVLERLSDGERSIKPYVHRVEGVAGVGDRLFVVPAGNRARELSNALSSIYTTPPKDQAYVFQVFVGRLRGEFEPDFILFDSRTGLAEIAAVCTVELAEVIVALTGLNPPGVAGLADVMGLIRRHPVRRRPPLFFLAYSPVPRAEDLGLENAWVPLDPLEPGSFRPEVLDHPLARRLADAHQKLWSRVVDRVDEPEVRQWFPAVPEHERLHVLEYDPQVPLIGEYDFDRPGRLRDAHERLARAVGLTSGHDLLPTRRPGPGADSWLERIGSLHHAVDAHR
jgi:MinD-like ATPase involved in chromosome partitioning or flagellar assembly